MDIDNYCGYCVEDFPKCQYNNCCKCNKCCCKYQPICSCKNGLTPTIGANGNWFIGTVDTGVSARGTNGITPSIGTNGNWFIGTVDTGVLARGTNGITPSIGANGNWFIGTIDTGVSAKGDKGDTGEQGPAGSLSTNAAFAANSSQTTLQVENPIPFPDNKLLTNGITMNAANTVFTVENAGIYLISYHINLQAETNNYTELFINGSRFSPSVTGSADGADIYEHTVLVNLSAGSTIALYFWGDFDPPAVTRVDGNSISIVRVAAAI